MTGINYKCLGTTEAIRERRYNVLSFYLRGAKPKEITELIVKMVGYKDFKIKDCYDDIAYLRSHPLHDLPLDMVRDFGKSFYEVKITELERSLKKYENSPSTWVGIQKLILQYKSELLKLTGASEEHVNHTGEITITYKGGNIDGDDRDRLRTPAPAEGISQPADQV